VVNNWRGWRKQQQGSTMVVGSWGAATASGGLGSSGGGRSSLDSEGNVLSLTELAAKEVASSIPFEAVERVYPPVPEPLQLRIAYYRYR